METQKNSQFSTIIVVVELLLTFVVGIMGNKVAEVFQLSTVTLGVTTTVCLLLLSIISYVRTHDFSANPIKDIKFGSTISRFVPKTVTGIFPFGLVSGLIFSITTRSTFQNLGYPISINFVIPYSDFWGIFVGVIFCTLIAIVFDGPLAGGLVVGYGVSFATGTVLIDPYDAPLYYLGYTLGAIGLAVLFFVAEPKLAIMRKIITEPRL